MERHAYRACFNLELHPSRLVSLRIQLQIKLVPSNETLHGASCALWTRFKFSPDQFLGRRPRFWIAFPSPLRDLANVSQRSKSVVFGATCSHGTRPLRCVQYPGEYLWVPHMWWHATKNLDANVAYGQRPAYTCGEVQKKTAAEQLRAAGGSSGTEIGKSSNGGSKRADSEEGIPLLPWPPEVPASKIGAALVKPFALDPVQPTLGGRRQWFDILGLQTWAAGRSLSEAAAAYNEVLIKVRAAVEGALPEDADLMRETAAFVHCHLAAQLGRVAADKKATNTPGTLDATTAAATVPLLADWAAIARNYSAAIFAHQCQRSGGNGHWVTPKRSRSRHRRRLLTQKSATKNS